MYHAVSLSRDPLNLLEKLRLRCKLCEALQRLVN